MPPKIEKKYTREYKVREIQKNLTKKARLKKEYLKTLKEEGYTPPEKDSKSAKVSFQEIKARRATETKKKLDEKKEMRKLRKKLQKEKADKLRENEMKKLQDIKQKKVQREERANKLSQRTKYGQPLMGPKIEDLLTKIKNDDTYTK
ncbi:LAFE_0B00892g1_1 [Lachancea fermentati]|uniref:rRNA-processing protein FYV7 n=1 Tax=Lachancea fermentati TaxID=4955 RepID=A0A1G4M7D8_LACFM|nr:LAFE_0B00892g1_1 [Lachancea fermentati]